MNILYIIAQSSMFYAKENDPRSTIIFLAVIGGGMLLIAVMNLINKLTGGSFGAGNQSSGTSYSRRQFRKEATALGLKKEQIKLLESLIKTYHVRRPFDMLKNSRTFNNTLGKALRDLNNMEAPPNIVEKRKLALYRIKQLAERREPEDSMLQHTKEIQLGQKLTIEKDNGKRFNSIVTANLKEFYCAKVPTNAYGEQVRWNRGTKVNISIWSKKGEEMHFTSKVMGYNSVKRITSILLSHSKRLSRSNLRKFRRKKIQKPVYVYPISIIERMEGRKIRKEAVVNKNQGRMGTLIDLSAGGCALTTTKPLKKGDLCKLNFEPTQGNAVTTFGKVVDMHYTSRIRCTMHIMFTRASTKNFNRINEFVYEFS